MKKQIAAKLAGALALFLLLLPPATLLATVSSTTTQVVYSGNGSTTIFPYTFYIPASTDLEVLTLNSLGEETELTTGFTVSGVGSGSGGNVTFTDAPASGVTLVLRRAVARTQSTDLVPNTRINAQVIENALDRLTVIDQDQQRDIDRALKLKTNTSYTSLVVPEPQAGYYLRWNADGDNLENVSSQTISGTVTFSGYGTGWVATSDEDSAWVLLGGAAYTRGLISSSTQTLLLSNMGASALTRTLWPSNSTGTWRTTLGCGTAATYDVGSSNGDVITHPWAPYGYLNGFTMVRTDATTITFSTGAARDSTDTVTMEKLTFMKQYVSPWAEGNDLGGCEDALGDGWWHAFVIAKSDLTVDFMFDTSATSPTLPTGYTYFRRLGSFLTSGGNIVEFSQIGDEFLWDDPPLDYSTAPGDTNAHTITCSVPTGVVVKAKIRAICAANSGYISSLFADDEAPSGTAAPLLNFSTSGGNIEVFTDTSALIRYRMTVSANLYVSTYGWVDRRGKDD